MQKPRWNYLQDSTSTREMHNMYFRGIPACIIRISAIHDVHRARARCARRRSQDGHATHGPAGGRTRIYSRHTKANLGCAQQPRRTVDRLAVAPTPSTCSQAVRPGCPRKTPLGQRWIGGLHPVPASATGIDFGMVSKITFGARGIGGRRHRKRPVRRARRQQFLGCSASCPPQIFMGAATAFTRALSDLACSGPSPHPESGDPADLAAFSQKGASWSFESEALQLALAGCSTPAAGLFGPALGHHFL